MLKKAAFGIGIFLLLGYTIFIITNEYYYGQFHVRQYLTDIKGDVVLYGINTTLTTLFLTLSAYNFFLCAIKYKKKKTAKKSFFPFYILQTLIFLYLAVDERFMVHERIGFYLGFEDALLLGGVGLTELILLLYYKELRLENTVKSYSLYLGGMFFGIMSLIDAFGALDGKLRLSFEDLSKAWAIFFLFVYSFEFYRLRQKS